MRNVLLIAVVGAVSVFVIGQAFNQKGLAQQLPKAKKDIPTTQPHTKTREAVLAGGCFWCTEGVFQELAGVISVESGYAGGDAADANYRAVAGGETDHAEAIRIRYDANQLSYGDLLRVHFATHDPTTLNRQGPDSGKQYRSAIFYANEQEKEVAEAYIKQLTEAKIFDDKIVTTLEPLTEFYVAEDIHQDFAERNPSHPYILQQSRPKIDKTRKLFPELLEKQDNKSGREVSPSTQPAK